MIDNKVCQPETVTEFQGPKLLTRVTYHYLVYADCRSPPPICISIDSFEQVLVHTLLGPWRILTIPIPLATDFTDDNKHYIQVVLVTESVLFEFIIVIDILLHSTCIVSSYPV